MDENCTLEDGRVVDDFHCMLNLVEGKSDKFYVLQLLENSKGHYVWTRWGRNGTKGQKKLEGPINQSEAIKNFEKKFQDKTKNKWCDRKKFKPVKGKYSMVVMDGASQSLSGNTSHEVNVKNLKSYLLATLEAEKPALPNTVVSGVSLHADVLYCIMIYLPTRDVLRCMQVCKYWKTVLSEKYFWKTFIYRHFDLTLKTQLGENDSPVNDWCSSDDWYCYYDDVEDPYVMRPFPSVWQCGVVHPFGLDPMVGDVKSLQGFSRSLEILSFMKKGINKFNLASGTQCSGSEGESPITTVIFPSDKEKLPGAKTIVDDIFHFHPKILKDFKRTRKEQGDIRKKKLMYHLPRPDLDEVEEDEDEDHDSDENPCLNSTFGFGYSYDEGVDPKEVDEFYSWLQSIMVPSIRVIAGADKMNPVALFFVTKLAPGWVGGALTGLIYT